MHFGLDEEVNTQWLAYADRLLGVKRHMRGQQQPGCYLNGYTSCPTPDCLTARAAFVLRLTPAGEFPACAAFAPLRRSCFQLTLYS